MITIQKKTRKTKRISGVRNLTGAAGRERARLDKKRIQRDRSKHWSYFWNVCPKCGGDMETRTILDVHFDSCRGCGGLYIDESELRFASKFVDSQIFMKALVKKGR